MIDSQFCINNENYKQIDDIIDARKKLGQYNVLGSVTNCVNYRFAYSSSISDRYVRFDDGMIIDGDYVNNNNSVKQTDSEVTVVRVKCNRMPKRRRSKWDMQDDAIPGDGSHLGESPSLVNLATLVAQSSQSIRCEANEYLVPLSSWDPYYKSDEGSTECWTDKSSGENGNQNATDEDANEDLQDILLDSSEECSPTNSENQTPKTGSFASSFLDNIESSDTDFKNTISRRPSLAGRISNFIRKHCRKSKTLPSSDVDLQQKQDPQGAPPQEKYKQ